MEIMCRMSPLPSVHHLTCSSRHVAELCPSSASTAYVLFLYLLDCWVGVDAVCRDEVYNVPGSHQ
jgi:hypothetical protein